MAAQFHPAQVDDNQLTEIQALETQLGKVVLALDTQPTAYATLSEKELAELQATEKKLGLVMLAFD